MATDETAGKMNFTTSELIMQIERKIENLNAIAQRNHEQAVQKYNEELADWKNKYTGAWEAYAQGILTRLATKRVITEHSNAKPKDEAGRYTAYYRGSTTAPEFKPANTKDLTALLNVLRACTDPKTSSATLERLGHSPASIYCIDTV